VRLAASSDQVHLALAIRDRRLILNRNHPDFEALNDLVALAANGHHEGILVIGFDCDPRDRSAHLGLDHVAGNRNRTAIGRA
jgi:hypothetical protein